jgi:GH25 family lysozyme M1 (1,4-beta-N-acetylmuramidase)
MRKLVDVSSYNGTVDWKKAKQYGVDGAILKIIRKDLKRDNGFNRNYQACNENHINWGVYNYTYATTPKKARADMELVCDILDKLDKKYFKLGVWFDIEDQAQAKLSKDEIASIINAAQAVVESRGYKFGVYTGMSYYNEHIDRKLVKCNNWWIARYYRGDARMQIATNPDQEKKPAAANIAWQYTSKGRFPKIISSGNSGNFDLNVLYKEPVAKKVEENTKKPVKKKIVYYPKYKGKSKSLVDALKSLGINSGKNNRKRIAVLNGIKNYSGTATQNTRLLNLLKKGKLVKNK